MYNKRKLKQTKLIKKLVYNIVKDNNIDIKNIPLKIGIYKNRLYSSCISYYHNNNDVKRQKIIIGLYGVKYNAKKGYTDSYYIGRGQKINPIISHSIKKSLRFVILHEVKHAIDIRQYKRNYRNTFNEAKREAICDSFGIDNIKKYIRG